MRLVESLRLRSDEPVPASERGSPFPSVASRTATARPQRPSMMRRDVRNEPPDEAPATALRSCAARIGRASGCAGAASPFVDRRTCVVPRSGAEAVWAGAVATSLRTSRDLSAPGDPGAQMRRHGCRCSSRWGVERSRDASAVLILRRCAVIPPRQWRKVDVFCAGARLLEDERMDLLEHRRGGREQNTTCDRPTDCRGFLMPSPTADRQAFRGHSVARYASRRRVDSRRRDHVVRTRERAGRPRPRSRRRCGAGRALILPDRTAIPLS
jgi:hypothetical protein